MKFNNKLIYLFIILIMGVALFFRLYRLKTTLYFTYDQGRDALVIQKILKGKLTLIGPTTGIPGFFLGPFFYYLIAPFYWIGGGNPIIPAIFLIILSVVGIAIASYIVGIYSGSWLAFFTCFLLLSINFSHIKHSRWLSNPNPIFILAPLYFLVLYLLLSKKRSKKNIQKLFLALGLFLGILLQTELANAIFFIPITLLVIILRKREILKFNYLKKFLTSFLITLLPIIVFNLRHKFIMITAFKNYFSQPQERLSLIEILKTRPKFYYETLTFFFSPKQGKVFLACLVLVVSYLLIKKFWRNNLFTILGLWFFVPLVFLLFYTSNRGSIWDYYLISQPIPLIMLLSLFCQFSVKKFKIGGFVITALITFLIIQSNLKEWQFAHLPESNKVSFGKMIQAIDFVYNEAKGQPFNVEAFVPNLIPVTYEYLFSWYGTKKYGYLPTPENNLERLLFFIMEPGQQYHKGEQYWRNQWYNQRQHSGKIVKNVKIGDIDVEVRERLSL